VTVVSESYGHDAKSFPGEYMRGLLTSMICGIPCRKGTLESGMENNEPVI
jgi:hypothetical protein